VCLAPQLAEMRGRLEASEQRLAEDTEKLQAARDAQAAAAGRVAALERELAARDAAAAREAAGASAPQQVGGGQQAAAWLWPKEGVAGGRTMEPPHPQPLLPPSPFSPSRAELLCAQ
jgi:hypothetical protein